MNLIKDQTRRPVQIYRNDAADAVMSVKDWIITLLILEIPLVNIIALIIWANGTGNKNRANFASASLILIAIGIVIFFCYIIYKFAMV